MPSDSCARDSPAGPTQPCKAAPAPKGSTLARAGLRVVTPAGHPPSGPLTPSPPLPPPLASPSVVVATVNASVTVATDCAALNNATTRAAFVADLLTELARVLAVDPSRLAVTSLACGSIVANYSVIFTPGSTPDQVGGGGPGWGHTGSTGSRQARRSALREPHCPGRRGAGAWGWRPAVSAPGRRSRCPAALPPGPQVTSVSQAATTLPTAVSPFFTARWANVTAASSAGAQVLRPSDREWGTRAGRRGGWEAWGAGGQSVRVARGTCDAWLPPTPALRSVPCWHARLGAVPRLAAAASPPGVAAAPRQEEHQQVHHHWR
jgi:hypothetical protein